MIKKLNLNNIVQSFLYKKKKSKNFLTILCFIKTVKTKY